ncbi:hypothetical protein [Flavicella sediminum]|uniref:hypothetical protein n=1 Tax=Flavicella sediminum TaxID=2585141 RepID=UPI0011240D2A|nr:hypothetical protein [Flavicella sediminum]
MLEEFTRNPWIIILAVFFIWRVLIFLLIKKSNLSKKSWASLEYIWIIIGFMGVISIVIKNDINAKKRNLESSERWIEHQFKTLLKFTKGQTICFQLKRSDWLKNEEFDRRQNESDKICNWVKQTIIPTLKESENKKYSKIKEYPNIELDYYKDSYTTNRIEKDIKKINEDIVHRDNLKKEISNNYWGYFQSSIGLIFLVFAFGLRLTLITKKVKDSEIHAQ